MIYSLSTLTSLRIRAHNLLLSIIDALQICVRLSRLFPVTFLLGVLLLGALNIVATFFCVSVAVCDSDLLFLEMQGVVGYSNPAHLDESDKPMFYSQSPEDVMQKPSIGMDYIRRISSSRGDIGTFAFQGRVAYDTVGDSNVEGQVYNAYFKYKTRQADFWIGHNRPALGLSSYFDSHGLLLPMLSMMHFGFDRDWGVGVFKNLDYGHNLGIGDASLSLTSGSGMPLYLDEHDFDNHYLLAQRLSVGNLNQDNYNVGLSLSIGKVLDTMGYHRIGEGESAFKIVGSDFTYLWDNYETRLDCMFGENMDESSLALLARFGASFLDDAMLKVEFEPVYTRIGDMERVEFYLSHSLLLTSDLVIRFMYGFNNSIDERKVILQIYFYKGI